MTPGTLSKSASTHQKHPPAKIAFAVFSCEAAPLTAAASRQAAINVRRSMRATSQVADEQFVSFSYNDRRANGVQLLSQSRERRVTAVLPGAFLPPSVA